MDILWTDEALDDFADIMAYLTDHASGRTAQAVRRRIIGQIEALCILPERIRASDRLPGARELVVHRLPYVVFVKLLPDAIVVLNVVHTARQFPPGP